MFISDVITGTGQPHTPLLNNALLSYISACCWYNGRFTSKLLSCLFLFRFRA